MSPAPGSVWYDPSVDALLVYAHPFKFNPVWHVFHCAYERDGQRVACLFALEVPKHWAFVGTL